MKLAVLAMAGAEEKKGGGILTTVGLGHAAYTQKAGSMDYAAALPGQNQNISMPDSHDEKVATDAARTTGQDYAPVIACELRGDEVGAQVKRWIRLGRDAGLERVETQDGLRIRFRDGPTVEEELRALVAEESNCCSWARWEIHRADGDLILTVSSTPEGAATLHGIFWLP